MAKHHPRQLLYIHTLLVIKLRSNHFKIRSSSRGAGQLIILKGNISNTLQLSRILTYGEIIIAVCS